jgi:hypothetical protein
MQQAQPRHYREHHDYRSDPSKEQRDVMMCDIPNAFIQALLPKKDSGEDRVVMKITGVLVNMLVDINPKLYGPAMWCWRTERRFNMSKY